MEASTEEVSAFIVAHLRHPGWWRWPRRPRFSSSPDRIERMSHSATGTSRYVCGSAGSGEFQQVSLLQLADPAAAMHCSRLVEVMPIGHGGNASAHARAGNIDRRIRTRSRPIAAAGAQGGYCAAYCRCSPQNCLETQRELYTAIELVQLEC